MKPFNPEFTIVIFIHYRSKIAVGDKCEVGDKRKKNIVNNKQF